MGPNSDSTTSTFRRIPPEVLEQMLRCCSDPHTLRSLALSTPGFFSTFVGRQTQIANDLFCQIIHPSVHRDAALALGASRVPKDDHNHVCDPQAFERFSDRHLRSGDTGTGPWSFRDILDAAPRHRTVDYLSRELSRRLLGRKPFVSDRRDGEGPRDPWPGSLPLEPTTTELCRFQRALYRFQAFCEIWPREASVPMMPTQPRDRVVSGDVWFDTYWAFSLIEIEQLACLNDIFMALLAPAFNDIVFNDITWGRLGVRLITSEFSKPGQYILSCGLEKLSEIIAAETYEERRRIMHRGEGLSDAPGSRADFLADRFHQSYGPTPYGADEYAGLSEEELQRYIRAPYYSDPDPGPKRVWRWLHLEDRFSVGLVAVHQFRHYRRWGYVFWDEERLENLGVFGDDWDEYRAPDDDFLGAWAVEGTRVLRDSQAARSKLWESGRRGFLEF